jgi:TPR repeat protein
MAGVFISYRREDSIAYAGRLYDRLQAHFGDEQVFMDIDTLQPGEDFVEAIQKTVASCDALVVVIGKHWLTAQDEKGQRRLDNPDDFVHIEIAAALERGIRVIPALVGGAQMPQSSNLPDALKKLTRRNAIPLPDIGFQQSVTSLIQALEATMQQAQWQDTGQAVPKKESTQRTTKQQKSSEAASSTTSEMSLDQLKKAAAARDLKAMTELGWLYQEGQGVRRNSQQARQWWEKAAAAGSMKAMTNLGVLYESGKDVSQDYQQARQWWEKAAAAEDVYAMRYLGKLYAKGHGVARDNQQARQWYEKAAAAGSISAKIELVLLRMRMLTCRDIPPMN